MSGLTTSGIEQSFNRRMLRVQAGRLDGCALVAEQKNGLVVVRLRARRYRLPVATIDTNRRTIAFPLEDISEHRLFFDIAAASKHTASELKGLLAHHVNNWATRFVMEHQFTLH